MELDQTVGLMIEKVKEFAPDRLVVDALTELRLLAHDSLSHRRQLLTLKRFFAEQRCTVMALDDLTDRGQGLQLHSIVHGVLSLEQRRMEYGAVRRRLRVAKLRCVDFRSGYHDFVIRTGGIAVFPSLVAAEHHVEFALEMLSSDVAPLDDLLGGGLRRGTSTLLIGPSGVGKSSLALHYTMAAARHGQRVAFFAFDENYRTAAERAAGLAMSLEEAKRSGALSWEQINPVALSPGEFLDRQALRRGWRATRGDRQPQQLHGLDARGGAGALAAHARAADLSRQSGRRNHSYHGSARASWAGRSADRSELPCRRQPPIVLVMADGSRGSTLFGRGSAKHSPSSAGSLSRQHAGVAHDFDNLLMVVSGGLDMLTRTSDPKRRERIIAGMREAASRGEALTRQLLAFSRRTTLRPEAIKLHARFESMGALIAGALGEDIDLELELSPDLWPVMVDPMQFEMALLNTIVNARDAMPRGGTLTIAAANARLDGSNDAGLAGEFVCIEIRDTGSGIPPEILDRIFDPFFTTKPIGSGTGLGLSQVYGFAKQSGGHVRALSETGKGAFIILHLPRAQSAPIDPPRDEPDMRVRRLHRRRSVLVVEDNDQVALLAKEMLEGLGFVVSRAASAPAALEQLEKGQKADLVFSDVVMPGGMSRIELARELNRRQPELPVVLTSGFSDVVRDGEVHGLMLLRKPYRLDELEAVLATALGERPLSGRPSTIARDRK